MTMMPPMMPQQNPRQAMRDASFATVDQGVAGKAPQQSVNYRPAENPQKACANCAQFRAPDQCAAVAGKISPQGTCDAWQGEVEGQQENTAEGGVEE